MTPPDITPETPRHRLLKRIERAKAMTGAERVRAGFEMSELAVRIVADGLRHQHPDADEATIERLLRERIDLKRRLENRRGREVES